MLKNPCKIYMWYLWRLGTDITFLIYLLSNLPVTFPHDRIRLGKIEIPELHDIIPGAFWKHKGIRIKFKKLGYESILIGGMAAGICR